MIQEGSANDTRSEERWLRRCLRDLIAFTSLPLLWKDKTPGEIAVNLAAVLESTLSPEFVLVRIAGSFAEEPINAARAARRYPELDAGEIAERVAPFLELECEESAITVPNPMGPGELQITLSSVGVLKEYGVVLVGSRAHDFPTTTERLLMNVASNQAAALLENVALRMRERELHAEVQRLGHAGSWAWNPVTGENSYWSDECFRLMGFDPAGGIPTFETVAQRLHPEDQPVLAEKLERARRERADFEVDYRIIHPGGEIRYIHAVGHPVLSPFGDLFEFVGSVIDLTERKRAEDEIRQSERELRHILDFAPQQVAVLGPDGTRIYSNQANLDYFGLTLEEWQSVDPRWFSHPDDFERTMSQNQTKFLNGIPHEVEMRLRGKDAKYRWFLLRYSPLRDEQGRITRWYLAGTDIEDRKQAEQRLQSENIALREEIDKTSMFEQIVGNSLALRSVLSRISKVAPTDSSVLITGETGTGKELVARAIHKRSRRAARAFVSVNCAAIPRDLIASELFGHEKGAFTGATQRRLGRFELAEGGTIFLDEVGELPAETQIALLRVLQEREFERVGAAGTIRSNVRVIAATNRDLEAAISAGTFRSDLFYRLNVFPIEMPSLRERREDIPLLMEYFIDRFARQAGKSFQAVNKKSRDLLQSYPWPGNIRELQNVIERSVIVCETETFSVDESWLSRQSPVPVPSRGLAPLRKLPSQEKEIIEAALSESGGQVYGPSGAAAKLGIPRSTLEHKIRSLKINKRRFKTAAHP